MSYGQRPYWNWGNYEVRKYDLLLYFVITAMTFFHGKKCLIVRDHIEAGEIIRYVFMI